MNKFKIGDFVKTKTYGHKGRITEIHGKCPESQTWIDGQKIPVTQNEISGIWYSVLCEPAGSVCVSEINLVKIKPFSFTNMWKDVYFGE